jgi:signal transduction histidine kinase
MWRVIKRRLGYKLFLSYLIVVVVGVAVLVVATELIVPSAFERHLSNMGHMMSGMMGGMGPNEIEGELFANFRSGVSYALSLAASSAFLTAIIVSWFVARQVVQPVREMVTASQRIAEGDYHSRIRVAGRVEDMDELSLLAFQFNQMATRLDQTEEMRRQLIGDVAHELRTPLTTIKGSMEGLMDGVLQANDETYLRVYHEADRLQRLVMDLQELSRVEGKAVEFQRKPVHLENLIQATVDRLRSQFEDKNVAVEVKLPASLPVITVDPDRIQQVLLNLVGNALQYTPDAGRVTISTQVVGEEIVVSVQDTGIGISSEHLPLIFTRFYRVEKSRSRAGGGSGIGLTIARYLVEAHGGRIWAESEGADRGSTFHFTLPVP